MIIGNRPRPQLQRTTSIMRITIEVGGDDQYSGQESDVAMMFSSENHRRKDDRKQSLLSPSSSFLGNCGFCKSLLAPSRDIYMYKGDAAFCSVECREQQIEHDEAKPRKSVVLTPSN